jgi:RsiW-degrading membrane proteinase PrsW (M82 family)
MIWFLLAFLLSFIPALVYAAIVYWTDRYEKEPKRLLLGVFLWGALVSVIGALIAELILSAGTLMVTQSKPITQFLSGSLYAPVIEESLKGLAVLLVFLISYSEFDSILDGIVYAGIVALGFAATENMLYLWDAGSERGVGGLMTLFFMRVILGAWDHPMYTAFTGIGLAMARLSPNLLVKLAAPVIGWCVGTGFHALHNGIILGARGMGVCLAFPIDWIGWLFIAGVIVWAVRRERGWLVKHLREEVDGGTLTLAQYRVAVSNLGRAGAALSALGRGQYRATSRFFAVCAELAFKKEQRERLGEERGNSARIAQLRDELARLSGRAR